VLVFLDSDAGCDARMHLAARFAARHDSHLIGVAPTGLIDLSAGFGAASHHLDEAALMSAESVLRCSEQVQRFRACCKAEGVASSEADVFEGDKAAVLLHQAHCADLVVIGQADPAAASSREQRRFVEQVISHNPRPTLLVPHAGRFDAVGDAVLVAWDDSPGAARAVADALPLLRHARQVHVRAWRPGDAATEQPIRERLEVVQGWLLRQGVSCEARVEVSMAPIGVALLACAARLGADLVVMGAYGHSRWAERIVGGTTRTALAQSALPLLMSH
jgi:nucleotide-binding universal stress UspA family protein